LIYQLHSQRGHYEDQFAIWAKRLEEGTYAMPFDDAGERRREITAQELGAILSGIDLSQVSRRKRYQRKAAGEVENISN
jgi:hypothetical protein